MSGYTRGRRGGVERPSDEELRAQIREADGVIVSLDAGAGLQDRLQIARTFIDRGDAQRQLRDSSAAAQSYERAFVTVEGQRAGDLAVREVRALALSLRAMSLVASKRFDDALADSTRALELAAEGGTSTLRRCQAVAMSARAGALRRLGRAVEAQQVADAMIADFADDPVHGPKRFNFVARGRFLRAMALMDQDKAAEAEVELSGLIDCYQYDQERSMQMQVGQARLELARALDDRGRAGDAAQIRTGLIAQYGDCEDRRFREIALLAGARLGRWLLDAEEQTAALQLIEGLQGKRDAESLHNPILERLLCLLLADAQLRNQQTDHAITTLRALLDRDDVMSPQAAKVVSLLNVAAEQLRRADRPADGLRLIDDGLARLRPHAQELEQLSLLWLEKPRLLRQTGALEEALAVCDYIVTTFSESTSERARHAVLGARQEKAVTLGVARHRRAALATCDSIISENRDGPELFVRDAVAAMMAYKAELQLQGRRPRAALRSLSALVTYVGQSPPEPLLHWVDDSRSRSTTIKAAVADRRRLNLVLVALFAIISAPWLGPVRRALATRTPDARPRRLAK